MPATSSFKLPLAFLLIAVAMVTTGCVFTMPGPSTDLNSTQVSQVLACQDTIKDEGQEFLKVKIKNLEGCLDKVLAAQVQLENGLITTAKFNKMLDNIRADCQAKYEKIGEASTELVNKIRDACGFYATTFLPGTTNHYDPLQFWQLFHSVSIPWFTSITTAEQLGGFICGVKEVVADVDVALQVPRFAELLGILGPGFSFSMGTLGVGIYNEYSGYISLDGSLIPAIPLDSRCFFGEVG